MSHETSHQATPSRRAIISAGALLPAAVLFASRTQAAEPPTKTDTFTYEVTRTEKEWRARLDELEYFVMREGGTEPRHQSLYTFEKREGSYRCKGCELTAFEASWKVQHPDIGWVFFKQAIPDTILTGIDEHFGMMDGDPKATIECHCRRCGSHFGHILDVRGEVLHCLNGTSLVFSAA